MRNFWLMRFTILSIFFVIGFPHAASALLVKTGTYTGNGINSREIVGFGFQPDYVIVMPHSAQYAVFRPDTLVGDATLSFDDVPGGAQPNQIKALRPDGFQVGTHPSVNASGVTYYYIGMQKLAGELTTGSYVGNGVAGTQILVGFQPNLVITRGQGVTDAVGRSSTIVGDLSFKMSSSSLSPNYIQALAQGGTNSFTIGSSSKVNTSGVTYHWQAWKVAPDSFNLGTYTGNGLDNRDIAGVGFQPEIVFIANNTSGTARPVIRTNAMVGDASRRLHNVALELNRIQGIQPDGFQVGTAAEVNSGTITYHWMAWKNRALPPSTLQLVKQVWLLGGSNPLATSPSGTTIVPASQTIVFLIYVKNNASSAPADIRIQDLLDITPTGFVMLLGASFEQAQRHRRPIRHPI